MIEEEWMACEDPTERLWYVPAPYSERKAWLFRVACCRRVWMFILDERSRNAVDVAERWVDGRASDEEVGNAQIDAEGAHESPSPPYPDGPFNYAEAVACATVAARLAIDSDRGEPSEYTAEAVAHSAFVGRGEAVSEESAEWKKLRDTERAAQCRLLNDIFGNPFRPVTIDPSWLTPTVLALASQMYESRDFSPMPILADALQDAGCENEAILNHCRQAGEHVRGCWVVDSLTGKK